MQVNVLLPLAIGNAYTYNVPSDMEVQMAFGIRVEVEFGKKKRYSGIIIDILEKDPADDKKYLLDIVDDTPILGQQQYSFWEWLAGYYLAYLGEVMNAALPAKLKLNSESLITATEKLNDNQDRLLELPDSSYLIAEALQLRQELSLEEVQEILGQKSVQRHIQILIDQELIQVHETLRDNYIPKKVKCYTLVDESPEAITTALEKVKNSDFQTQLLLAFAQLKAQRKKHITQNDVKKTVEVRQHAINALLKKGIIREYEIHVNRVDQKHLENSEPRVLPTMTKVQQLAYEKLKDELTDKKVALLHGITGSGKTRLYLELITQQIKKGGQILYLLPEIALTSQTIIRIADYVDCPFLVYHSRISENERVDIYQKVMNSDTCFVIGARSALLLPFHNLELVIVDEEHDTSYKQQDPSPRYHARDAAIVLAVIHSAYTVLGTATPSLESYHNAQIGKYGYVGLNERFGGTLLPEIEVSNLSIAKKKQPDKVVFFTPKLLEAIEQTLKERKQIILFKNRRGYAPHLFCPSCGWKSNCIRCDITLTYHKRSNELKCHYCGYHTRPPQACPECGFWHLEYQGAGTERIEQELKEHIPDASIKRFDADSVGSRRRLEETIFSFDQGEIDVLVGTQMLTKGLDFSNVGLVGVLNVDSLLAFSDFRATERTFQTIIQVAGRAGRKTESGKVILQMYNPKHPIASYVQDQNQHRFYQDELHEREQYHYPPYVRMIDINLRHKDVNKLDEASNILYRELKKNGLGVQIFEPIIPYVSYVKNMHQRQILMKLQNKAAILTREKENIKQAIIYLKKTSGMSTVRISVDVDPIF